MPTDNNINYLATTGGLEANNISPPITDAATAPSPSKKDRNGPTPPSPNGKEAKQSLPRDTYQLHPERELVTSIATKPPSNSSGFLHTRGMGVVAPVPATR